MRLITRLATGMIVALASATVILPTQAAQPAAPKPAAKPTIDLKAQKTEGKQMTGTLVRHQQAYYLENSAFASTIDQMMRPSDRSKATSYRYQMTPFAQSQQPAVMILSRPTKRGLPTYVGLVRIVELGNKDVTSMAIVCESTRAAAVSISAGSIPKPQADGMPTCPTGFTSLR
jgi:type IV pilus assembly protein PilA